MTDAQFAQILRIDDQPPDRQRRLIAQVRPAERARLERLAEVTEALAAWQRRQAGEPPAVLVRVARGR